MAKTAEEIRLEKMAADPNWAANTQKQIAKVDRDFPALQTPKRKLGIGPPPVVAEARPRKISPGIAAQVSGLMNTSEKKQIIDLLDEEEKGKI